ncbi:3D domain-containing protein [Paraclostridium bifermentans]|uniref:3D domain-containing protein n=1 Tax=Paraclostridium bifermentans TaxID=1490 RepID=UPI002FCD1475
MYFLFKKIFVLTTSLALSMFGINEFCAHASVLNNENKKVVNVSYLEKHDDNNDINSNNVSDNKGNAVLIKSDNDIIISDIPTSNNVNIAFTSTVDNIMNDVSIYNKKVEEQKVNEAETKADAEANAKTETKTQEASTSYKATYTMEATAYTGDTTTATGVTPVRNPNGLSTIAVDPSIIPLGSKVYIPGYGEAVAADTGGAIKGHRIDLFLNSENECINWGRQNVTLYILAYPGEW